MDVSSTLISLLSTTAMINLGCLCIEQTNIKDLNAIPLKKLEELHAIGSKLKILDTTSLGKLRKLDIRGT